MVDFGNVELSWLEEGEKLFKPDEDWWYNACLNYGGDQWVLYIDAYKRAAKALLKYVEENRGSLDFFVFPIVFLHRQYLELRLKKLLIDGKSLLDEELNFPGNHFIDQHWAECKKILNKVWADDKDLQRDARIVDSLITEFVAFDKNSFAFRYPTDVKGNLPSLPEDLKHINIRNMTEVMEKLSNFLDSAAQAISVYLEQKQDIEADMRGYQDL